MTIIVVDELKPEIFELLIKVHLRKSYRIENSIAVAIVIQLRLDKCRLSTLKIPKIPTQIPCKVEDCAPLPPAWGQKVCVNGARCETNGRPIACMCMSMRKLHAHYHAFIRLAQM